MKKANKAILALISTGALASVAACSQETQSNAAETVERAAADTEANAEVVGEAIQDGAANAAGGISEGAAALEGELDDGDRNDAGKLDGADDTQDMEAE